MNLKMAFIAVLVLVAAQSVYAKDQSPSELSKNRSLDKMPVASVAMPGYEEAKKALSDHDRGPSLMEIVQKKVDVIVRALKHHHGDPKTDYSKRENRMHSKKGEKHHHKVPDKSVDLAGSTSVATNYLGDVVVSTYSFDVSAQNPYEQVSVVYDAVTMQPISATGFVTERLTDVPDLSGMSLVYTAVRADGSLAIQRFETAPSTTGSVTQVSISYDFLGNVTDLTRVTRTPLDLKKVKLP